MVKITFQNSFSNISGLTGPQLKHLKEKLSYDNKEVYLQKVFLEKRLRYQKKGTKEYNNTRWAIKNLGPVRICWLTDQGQYPTGLTYLIEEGLNELKVTKVITEDKREAPDGYLSLRWRNKTPDLRYYQQEMLETASKNARGVFSAAVGSGKSLVITELIKQKDVNTLVVVPSLALLEQIYRTLHNHFGNKVEKLGKKGRTKPITICNVQSLAAANKSGKIDNIIKDLDMLIVDEVHHCLSGSEKIFTDKGVKSIKNIVDNKLKVKALSYNEKTGKNEYKPIINYWKYEAPKDMIEIELDNGKKIKCTENHKIYTRNRGYVEAGSLTNKDDVIIDSCKICPICNKQFDTTNKMTGHMTSHYMPKEKYIELGKALSKHPNHNNPNARRLNSLSKLGDKNVSKRPELRKRNSKRMKQWFHSLPKEKQIEQITRFQNAPRFGVSKGPTKLEKRILNLDVKEIRFTGDGKFWLTSNKKRLNPDFKIKEQRKVIEVGDIKYWHNKKDIEQRITLLNKIDFRCLYLSSDVMKELHDKELRFWIKEFING